MADRKKKKKAITERRAQAKAKKTKKAKIVRMPRPAIMSQPNPSILDLEAPEGFRVESFSQALMEYGKPIFEHADDEDIDSTEYYNSVLNIVTMLWNFTIKGGSSTLSAEDIKAQMEITLEIDSQEASELFDLMIARKPHLIPEDIQPENRRYMFVRKEELYIIPDFDYESLQLATIDYPIGADDQKLLESIREIDSHLAMNTDYLEWEEDYFSMETKCEEQYRNWLTFKGCEQFAEDFPYCISVYLNFIYCHCHEAPVNLKTISAQNLEEFFLDHLLRKVQTEPHEYTFWPPSLKLLYAFLKDIGYLTDPDLMVEQITEIELLFIAVLRERYQNDTPITSK